MIGSYASAGYLYSTLSSTSNSINDYARFLDLDSGITTTTWKEENSTISRYASYAFSVRYF